MQVPRVSVLVALLTASLAPGLAQLQQAGPCPNITGVTDFNIYKFTGTWFEQIHTKRWSDGEMDCSRHYFEMNSAWNFSYNTYSRNPNLKTVYYKRGDVTLRPLRPSGSRFALDVTESDGETNTAYVLATDYTSYATLWTCLPADNSHYENVVVLTRDKFPGLSALLSALDALDANKLPRMYLVYTEQRNCPDFNLTTSTANPPTPTSPDKRPTTNITVKDATTEASGSTMPETYYTEKQTQSTNYDKTSQAMMDSTLIPDYSTTTRNTDPHPSTDVPPTSLPDTSTIKPQNTMPSTAFPPLSLSDSSTMTWNTDSQNTMPSTLVPNTNTSKFTSLPTAEMTTMPNSGQSSSTRAMPTTMPAAPSTGYKSTVLSNSTTGVPVTTMKPTPTGAPVTTTKPSAATVVTSSAAVTVMIYAILCFVSF